MYYYYEMTIKTHYLSLYH